MAAISPHAGSSRAYQLTKFFNLVIRGERTLTTAQEGKLFIDSICSQADPPTCVEKLISGPAGLGSVQACIRFDVSPTFINDFTTRLLKYLASPTLEAIHGGSLLQQVIKHLVEPPLFWTAFLRSFRGAQLDLQAQESFAWLLLELLNLPNDDNQTYIDIARDASVQSAMLNSANLQIRTKGQKIKKFLLNLDTPGENQSTLSAGGRHDNDFSNFRQISILPTADELLSKEPPFLCLAEAIEAPNLDGRRSAIHLDSQFRLLREDMLSEMREETGIILGNLKGHHKGLVLNKLSVKGIDCGTPQKRLDWGLQLQCNSGIRQLAGVKSKERKKYLLDHRDILGHQSLTCLIIDGEITAFPSVHRDVDLLAREPPIVTLNLKGERAITRTLLKLKTSQNIQLVQINTGVFSFEPILRQLQRTVVLPLEDELLDWAPTSTVAEAASPPAKLIRKIVANPSQDLKAALNAPKSIMLDNSQATSLLTGLKQRVSLIQGPPGTGKSFIGALIAKSLIQFTQKTLLVVCYKNHALDQFLEDLLDIGIPSDCIVRLGSKSTERTKPLTMFEQSTRNSVNWTLVNNLKSSATAKAESLDSAFNKYNSTGLSKRSLLEFLEFSAEGAGFYEAFEVPYAQDGMTTVGTRGKAVDAFYLLDRWSSGADAGMFKSRVKPSSCRVWKIPRPERAAIIANWRCELLRDQAVELAHMIEEYNATSEKLARAFRTKNEEIIKSKRIVACTTTAAAMYTEDLQGATRDVVLVEEAGEILESHILTALGPKTQQLILIGDHKQLRPKINDHRLSVERGEGYDLNRSLFERLILKGFPHQTLLKQHRMRPEISSLIRLMTYPDLEDAASTKGRPNLRGLQDNIIFLNHDHAEEGAQLRLKSEDFGADTSKRNEFEADLVVKCVRYLAQQGYGTENVVVLTAYLAQVSLLRDKLSKTHDPVLNDLDSFDLVRAGLMPMASAKFGKRSIHLSTIDNYQGEEKDIVIASLTRNNPSRDIGWLAQSERLNVLLSRARNALILIGNAETFVNARKGKAMWNQLFDELKRGGHIYDGFPVKCERHPERKALLKTPEEFDSETPDGGCKEACEAMLSCGLHRCPQRCHQLQDHSKMPCETLLQDRCAKGHVYLWKCHNSRPKSCPKCEREAREAEKQRRRELERQRKRDLELEEHNKKIAKMNETIEKEAQARKDAEEAQARANALKQKQKDVENAIALSHSVVNEGKHQETGSSQISEPQSAATVPQPDPGAGASPVAKSRTPLTTPMQSPVAERKQNDSTPLVARKMNTSLLSLSRQEWQRQKDIEGARNEFIDSIMDMIGLEDVKAQILRIKAKIDVNRRQQTDCKDERFNISLLGNPGTGKTTVARLYAKFLTSLDVLPGLGFLETTGSLIAHEGIAGAKKMIDSLHNAGGGAFFIDEAYQLTSGHNFGGGPVLDYLLAEMENNIGKIVFIVAGYNREMEKFFEHNPGLTSRVPYSLQFNDYTDEELLCILQRIIRKKYQGRMIIEDDDDGLFMRIVVRRLGRGRERPGFGNARAMQTIFAKICERQAERLNCERKHGLLPNDFFMSKEDLIGPDPSIAVTKSKAWEDLQELTGLKSVKASVQTMIDRIETNYKRELEEKEPVEVSLNRCFLGAPGTGKTSVAKLYGQVMVDVGLLSNGEVIVKNPSDFIGSHIGESEKNTKAILASTKGKVLVIDEAYMLYEGKDGGGNRSDPYRTAVVDTLVAEIQSVPGEDRCVLLLGYEDQMRRMFDNVNPGLSRRFAIEASFLFEDFTLDQLMEILESKMRRQDLGATDGAKPVARDVLERASRRPNFGNAGEVENQLGHAKNRFQARQSAKKPSDRAHNIVFEPQDFDPDFDRVSKAASRLTELFKDIVGCEDVVTKLSNYQKIAHSMKRRGLNPSEMIPTNFLFKGPPGTGKTTTARNMGQVFYDMGILSDAEVIDCAASDLIGQYVGHTSPKTVAQLDKALGKVLFIDEAYRLAEGNFAAEALNELVDQLTKPRYNGKLVVILAGYEKDINKLVSTNPGLSSRFSEEVMFYEMTMDECLKLLERDLKRQKIDTPPLSDPNEPQQLRLISLFRQLSSIPSWGNARDVKTLARSLAGTAFKNSINVADKLILSFDEIIDHAKVMLAERQIRSANLPSNPRSGAPKGFSLDLGAQPPARSASKSNPGQSASDKPDNDGTPRSNAKTTSNPTTQPQDPRDDGVTDEVWGQLQRDKQAEERRSQLYDATCRNQENQVHLAKAQEAEKEAAARKLAKEKAEDDAAKAELKRRHDIARRQEQEARIAREQAQRELERIRAEEARRKKLEAEKQAKLRNMGVCIQGFRWIKQSGGYRCAGGLHFVSDAALGL